MLWGGRALIDIMATVRITEAELARDIHAVLAKVQEGVEVIVEQDHRPVAVIRTPRRSGRQPISAFLVGQIEGQEAAKGNVLPHSTTCLLPRPPLSKAMQS